MESVRQGITHLDRAKRIVAGVLAVVLFTVSPCALATEFLTNTTIASGDTTYDGQDIIVTGVTLTVNGSHSFNSLLLRNDAVLKHNQGETLTLDITTSVEIDSTSTIDVTALGNPPASVGPYSGGSYGGLGGAVVTAPNSTYGDYLAPVDLGTGGGQGDYASGSLGGGAVKLLAGSLILNGDIIANGDDGWDCGGGSGGSVWMDISGELSGSGKVQVNGGAIAVPSSLPTGGGGGGRIAIYYGSLDPAFNLLLQLHAAGGKGSDPLNDQPKGQPGTIHTEDRLAPAFINSTDPSGWTNQAAGSVVVQFDSTIDPATFTLDDVSVLGPVDAVALSGITAVDAVTYSVDFVAPVTIEGEYTVTIGPNIATPQGLNMDQDQDGTPGEATDDVYTSSFTLDLTAPVAPAVDTYTVAPAVNTINTTSVTLTGTREDNTAVLVDSVEQVALGSGTWQATLTLPVGSSALVVEAADAAGNASTSVNLNFFVDTVAPTITIMTPADGSILTSASSITLAFVEEDSGLDLNVSTLTVTRNAVAVPGSWAEQSGNVVFTPSDGLVDGDYTVSAELVDVAGSSSAPFSAIFTLDSTPPTIPVISSHAVAPAINATNLAGVTLSGTREDNSAIFVDGVERVALGSGPWQTTLSSLPEGGTTVTVHATDAAGNASDSVAINLLVDTVPPSISGMTPANGDFTNAAATISLGFVEEASGVDIAASTLTVTRNALVVAGTWVEQTGNLVFTAANGLAEGDYSISAQLVDVAGSSSTPFNGSFTLDQTPPAAPGLDPLPEVTTNETETVTGTKAANTAVWLNGSEVVALSAQTTWSYDVTLVEGDNPLSFTLRDQADNESLPTTASVYYDSTSPPLVSFSADGAGDGTSVALDWGSYDEVAAGDDIESYLVYRHTATFSQVTEATLVATVPAGTKTYSDSGLSRNQSYYYAVAARDTLGNMLTGVTPIAVTLTDVVAPEEVTGVQVDSLADALTVSWSAPADSAGDLAGYTIYFNNDAGTQLDAATTSHSVSGLSAATAYPIRITARDNDGNESTGVNSTGVTLLGNPTGLATEPFSGKVAVSWSPLADESLVDHYAVYAAESNFANVAGMSPRATVPAGQASAQVAGLTDGTLYYFAVTTVNSSGGENDAVTTVSDTPNLDDTGPDLTNLQFGGASLVEGATVTASGALTVVASDPLGVSRVVFSLEGGTVLGTDAAGAAGAAGTYSADWDIRQTSDGAHVLTVTAYDSRDNVSTVTRNLTVDLAPPAAPAISSPNDGYTTNEPTLQLAGSAEPGSDVHLYNNNAPVGTPVTASPDGSFSGVVTLSEGTNVLQAAAENRGGLGPKSSSVSVTLDTSIPDAPTGITARALEGGPVKLSWNKPLDSAVVGYDVYRSTQPFTDITQATKANSVQVAGTSYEDLPPADGTYYYRVVAANEVDTISAPSAQVSATSDHISPRAVSIDYLPQGNQDPDTGAVGPGWVKVTVTSSEPLLTTPFLSLKPANGVPISVTLTAVGETQYEGGFDVTEYTPTGTADAVFSARDEVGNPGAEIDTGATLEIDTDGPAAAVTVSPAGPIKNDSVNPVTLYVTLALDEAQAAGTLPSLEYLLSAAGRTAVPVDNLVQIAALEWKGSFTLPGDAGAAEVETLSFQYQGTDAIGNVSTSIAGDLDAQVYQGALPPLGVPDGLTGKALSGGQVQLTWNPVEEAVEYQIYRQAPGEGAPSLYQRSATVDFTDTTALDGDYVYTVASVRQENGEEALSGQSTAVTVTADASAPAKPTDLSLNLVGSGIEATWVAPAGGETLTYSLYRSDAEIGSIEGAAQVLKDVAQLTAIDGSPSQSDHFYAVTAVDAAGNESVPSDSVYLNFGLLPVASLDVVLNGDGNPVVSWTHEGATVKSYDIYLGADQSLKLNASPLMVTSYEDTGYDGGDRTYTVVAVDNQEVPSKGRTVTLPSLSATLTETSQVKRGLFNRLAYTVTSTSEQTVDNIRMVAEIGGYTQESEPFSLASGESRTVPVIVGGYADLTDISLLTSTIKIQADTGEIVQRMRSADILVGEGALVAGLTTENLVRGGEGQVRLSLENTSDVETEIVTATSNGQSDSSEVRFKLIDADGNVLSTVGLKDDGGNNPLLTRIANGSTIARLSPGAVYTSKPIVISVPGSAPDQISVVLEIDSLHYHSGRTDALTVGGLRSERAATLVDTAYYGTVDAITPDASFGDEPIVITGKSLDRQTDQPLAAQPLNLVIRSNGFERSAEVYTDSNGSYSYTFTPLPGEAGVYTVSSVHPDVLDRPEQGQFQIDRVLVRPTQIDMNISRNYEQRVDLAVDTSDWTAATNLHLSYEAVEQPGGIFPDGVTVSLDPAINLGSGESGTLGFTIVADNSSADTETLVFKVFSDESGTRALATVRLDARFSEALPVLAYTPTFVDTGVTQESHVTETVTLENQGLADMYDVNVSLLNQDGSAPPDWAYLTSGGQLGRIAIGQQVPVTIAAAPDATVPDGDYMLKLRITASNHDTRELPVHVAVTQSGQGDILFHVSDIYTGTQDASDNLITGVDGARIRVQNEDALSQEFTLTTDASGEAQFANLAAGWYRFRASADNHEESVGRFQIKPGVTASREVFLSYNLVSVEWSVTEITLEDRYEINIETTFETQVPAPVVVAEPASVNLPDMAPGDVFYGEFTLTNYGLVRADTLQIELPQNDEFVRYELLAGVPATLEAKERITIPYRVVALKSFVPTGDSGGGCGTYGSCMTASYSYTCAGGAQDTGSSNFCVLKTFGDCTTAEGTQYPPLPTTSRNIGLADGLGSWGSWGSGGDLGYTPSYQSMPGAECVPPPKDCPVCKAPGSDSGG